MTIGTDAAIEFFGTQDLVSNSTSAVTGASFSVAADQSAWTNDDDAVTASVVFSGTFGTPPGASSEVALFARLMDIDGTNDQQEPSVNFPYAFVGAFLLDTVNTAQFIVIDITLPNTKTSQIYNFYIQNNADQTLSAGWTAKITPKAIGPHA